MLTQNHPDDERLSAMASDEPEALADADLVDHAQTCTQCSTLVADLLALRVSLAQLPDIEPSRPLRLLPDVPSASVDRVGGWARRIFGPVMAAGAAIALVGMVGTVAPSMGGAAMSGADQEQHLRATDVDAAAYSPVAPAVGGESVQSVEPDVVGEPRVAEEGSGDDGATSAPTESFLERSIWPMVLFSGVALLVAGGLLRWILVPRAG